MIINLLAANKAHVCIIYYVYLEKIGTFATKANEILSE